VLSQSRGAWIGIAAAAAAAPLVMRAGGRHFTVRRTWKTAAALACVLLFAAGFFVLNAQARERLANMANVRHFDAAGRLAMWRASLDMIRSRPLLGGGPGSFASGYPARHARILRENPAFPYFHTENAHNDWLQLPAEEGVLVFGLWLWIWAIFAAGAWRGVRAGNSTAAGFLLGFSALQVNAFFNFPWYLIPSQGWFWFAWGWLNGGEGNAGRAGKTSQRRIAVAAVVPLVVGVLIGRDLIANGWLKLSGDFLAASRWREAFLCSTRAQERWVGWENRYRAADNGSRAAYQLGDYKEAERQCRRSLAEFPDMPGGLSQLGLVLARQGRLAEAKAACARALYLNRHQADSWHVLGNIAFIERDNREAARCWRRAVEENPGLTGARDSLAALEAGNRKRKM
jgi:tetratricopeptide (TPR) repeat protein